MKQKNERKYKKELELIDDFCKFLQEIKCRFKQELRKRTYHSEGYVDIVINKDNKFIAIEAKLTNFRDVYLQSFSNKYYFDYSYILYPILPRNSNMEKLRREGIGLIYESPSETFSSETIGLTGAGI